MKISTWSKSFVQADSFDVVYGGGEANVAVSLTNYGHHAYLSPNYQSMKSDKVPSYST